MTSSHTATALHHITQTRVAPTLSRSASGGASMDVHSMSALIDDPLGTKPRRMAEKSAQFVQSHFVKVRTAAAFVHVTRHV